MEDEVAIGTCSGKLLFLKSGQMAQLISAKESI